MTRSCLFLNWHYPSSGIILEIGHNSGSEFYFLEEDHVYGPFDSFFDNHKVLEFHDKGIFFQFLIKSKKWHAIAPWKSKIIEYENIIEINNFILISENFFQITPTC